MNTSQHATFYVLSRWAKARPFDHFANPTESICPNLERKGGWEGKERERNDKGVEGNGRVGREGLPTVPVSGRSAVA
jgi:hypothetical protein